MTSSSVFYQFNFIVKITFMLFLKRCVTNKINVNRRKILEVLFCVGGSRYRLYNCWCML
jgi:hypothetical protein